MGGGGGEGVGKGEGDLRSTLQLATLYSPKLMEPVGRALGGVGGEGRGCGKAVVRAVRRVALRIWGGGGLDGLGGGRGAEGFGEGRGEDEGGGVGGLLLRISFWKDRC